MSDLEILGRLLDTMAWIIVIVCVGFLIWSTSKIMEIENERQKRKEVSR